MPTNNSIYQRLYMREYRRKHKVEKFAALAFWQWQAWTRYFLQGKHNPDDLAEWCQLIAKDVKYDDLQEDQKENYRFWARKMLEITENAK